MRIVACLAWYEETVESLERCVASLAGVADFLLAVDGRWALFPGDRDLSPMEQTNAIQETARAVGLECEVHGGGQPFVWDSQVAKRDYLMREAAKHGDWLLVIDGDEHIVSADTDALRAGLATMTLDVAQVMCRHCGGGTRQPEAPIRRIYRVTAGVGVETAHNGYRAADGRWLHGDPAFIKLEPADDLSAHITVAHDIEARPKHRRTRSIEYRHARARQKVEAWR